MEATVTERRAWRREFDKLGPGRVRGELTLGRWPPEKRALARTWLEEHDILHWQKNVPAGKGPRKRMNPKVVGLIVGVVFGLFALTRLFRSFW